MSGHLRDVQRLHVLLEAARQIAERLTEEVLGSVTAHDQLEAVLGAVKTGAAKAERAYGILALAAEATDATGSALVSLMGAAEEDAPADLEDVESRAEQAHLQWAICPTCSQTTRRPARREDDYCTMGCRAIGRVRAVNEQEARAERCASDNQWCGWIEGEDSKPIRCRPCREREARAEAALPPSVTLPVSTSRPGHCGQCDADLSVHPDAHRMSCSIGGKQGLRLPAVGVLP